MVDMRYWSKMAIIKEVLDTKARIRGFENWAEMSKHLEYSVKLFIEECLATALDSQRNNLGSQRSLI